MFHTKTKFHLFTKKKDSKTKINASPVTNHQVKNYRKESAKNLNKDKNSWDSKKKNQPYSLKLRNKSCRVIYT